MPSNVIRIVNLHKDASDLWLKNYIGYRMRLRGQIKQIYVRKHDELNLIYAYVIFESNMDAEETVKTLDGFVYGINEWDVSLIGPSEHCKEYAAELQNDDEIVPDVEVKRNYPPNLLPRRHRRLNHVVQGRRQEIKRATVNLKRLSLLRPL